MCRFFVVHRVLRVYGQDCTPFPATHFADALCCLMVKSRDYTLKTHNGSNLISPSASRSLPRLSTGFHAPHVPATPDLFYLYNVSSRTPRILFGSCTQNQARTSHSLAHFDPLGLPTSVYKKTYNHNLTIDNQFIEL